MLNQRRDLFQWIEFGKLLVASLISVIRIKTPISRGLLVDATLIQYIVPVYSLLLFSLIRGGLGRIVLGIFRFLIFRTWFKPLYVQHKVY